jgi:GT2 family glycosyltransferase
MTVRSVDVVVVAYGDPANLATCLESLQGAYPAVVVDNGSSLETRRIAEAAGASYLDPGTNLGFGAAVNRAVAGLAPDRDAVLLLNPDAYMRPAAVERLREEIDADVHVACVAPAQHRPGSDRAAVVCWPFPTPLRAWAEAVGLGRFVGGWGYVIASVLLVRRGAFFDVGGFDEGFFLYAEEADWERRATRRGWTVRYCADAEAVHAGAATDPDTDRRHVRFHAGVERYMRKWHGQWGWRSYQAATVLTALRRGLVGGRARRHASMRLAGLYTRGPYHVGRRSGAVPERHHHVPFFGAAEEGA